MNKQLKKVLFALLAAGCVLSAAACTETKAFTREEAEAQLDGFIVPESVTQEIGSEYAIPKVVVFDSDGGEHTPEVSAKCGDKTAEIVGGKLRLEKLQEYTPIRWNIRALHSKKSCASASRTRASRSSAWMGALPSIG